MTVYQSGAIVFGLWAVFYGRIPRDREFPFGMVLWAASVVFWVLQIWKP